MVVLQMRASTFPNPSAGLLASVRSISSEFQALRFPLLRSARFPTATTTMTVIRMGGGPRTYPGGVSKWQWKRMQQKKSKQLLKARLCRERQLYEMRKRTELKAAVGELEKPWEDAGNRKRAPVLFSVTADEQVKTLADRFQKPGGYDLWSPNDGPQLFHTPDGLPSARFFPKGVVHSIKPYTRDTTPPRNLDGQFGSDQEHRGLNSDSRSSWRRKSDSSVARMLRNNVSSTASTNFSSSRNCDSEGEGEEHIDGGIDEEEDKVVGFVRSTAPVTKMLRNIDLNSVDETNFSSLKNYDSDFVKQEEFTGAEVNEEKEESADFVGNTTSIARMLRNNDVNYVNASKFDSVPELDSDTEGWEEFGDGKADEEEEQGVGLDRNTRLDVNRRKGLIGQSKIVVNRRNGSSGRLTRRSKIEREYEEVFADGRTGQVSKPTKVKPRNRIYRQR